MSREQWLEARRELLAEEKRLTKLRDELTRKRQAMPWVEVETDYRFESPAGEVSLADLFGERSQLIVQHFMYGADWGEDDAQVGLPWRRPGLQDRVRGLSWPARLQRCPQLQTPRPWARRWCSSCLRTRPQGRY